MQYVLYQSTDSKWKMLLFNDLVEHANIFFTKICKKVMMLSDSYYCKQNWTSRLQGNFRPVKEIGEAVLLNDLSGEVPEDFPEGVYIRNGELQIPDSLQYGLLTALECIDKFRFTTYFITSKMFRKLSSKCIKLLDWRHNLKRIPMSWCISLLWQVQTLSIQHRQ